MDANLPLAFRFANANTALEIVNNTAQMTDQLRFLGVYHRDQLLVIRTAAASPARGQWRERSDIAVAELASQPFDATDSSSTRHSF
jgi:hypothetical protein